MSSNFLSVLLANNTNRVIWRLLNATSARREEYSIAKDPFDVGRPFEAHRAPLKTESIPRSTPVRSPYEKIHSRFKAPCDFRKSEWSENPNKTRFDSLGNCKVQIWTNLAAVLFFHALRWKRRHYCDSKRPGVSITSGVCLFCLIITRSE